MMRGDITPDAKPALSGGSSLASSSPPKWRPLCKCGARLRTGDLSLGDEYALSLSSASHLNGLETAAASPLFCRAFRTAKGGGEPGEPMPPTPNSSDVSSELSLGDASGVEKPLNDCCRGEPPPSLLLSPENGAPSSRGLTGDSGSSSTGASCGKRATVGGGAALERWCSSA